MHEKGFITIAIGDYYKYLAINLVKTYRLNGGNTYPFAVVTDKPDEQLTRYFDHVILEDEKLEDAYLYKLKLPEYTAYDKTIFVDADCFVIKEIDWYWDFFKKTSFGVFGRNTDVDDEEPVRVFDKEKAISEFKIRSVPRFNGGIYYFLQEPESLKVFEDARSFMPFYDEYGMPRFSNIKTGHLKMGDEPLFALALAKNGIKAMDCPAEKGMWNINGAKYLSINLHKQNCSYQKYGEWVYPSIVHFGTDNSKRYHYKKEAVRLNYIDKGIPESKVLKVWLSLNKIFYMARVQLTRLLFFKFSFDDPTPVQDVCEKKLIKITNRIFGRA